MHSKGGQGEGRERRKVQTGAFHAWEHKMYIKPSGNPMDTQHNINILLLCLSRRLHEGAITNGWPVPDRRGARAGRVTAMQEALCLLGPCIEWDPHPIQAGMAGLGAREVRWPLSKCHLCSRRQTGCSLCSS